MKHETTSNIQNLKKLQCNYIYLFSIDLLSLRILQKNHIYLWNPLENKISIGPLGVQKIISSRVEYKEDSRKKQNSQGFLINSLYDSTQNDIQNWFWWYISNHFEYTLFLFVSLWVFENEVVGQKRMW